MVFGGKRGICQGPWQNCKVGIAASATSSLSEPSPHPVSLSLPSRHTVASWCPLAAQSLPHPPLEPSASFVTCPHFNFPSLNADFSFFGGLRWKIQILHTKGRTVSRFNPFRGCFDSSKLAISLLKDILEQRAFLRLAELPWNEHQGCILSSHNIPTRHSQPANSINYSLNLEMGSTQGKLCLSHKKRFKFLSLAYKGFTIYVSNLFSIHWLKYGEKDGHEPRPSPSQNAYSPVGIHIRNQKKPIRCHELTQGR